MIECHRTTVQQVFAASNKEKLRKNDQVGHAFSICEIDKLKATDKKPRRQNLREIIKTIKSTNFIRLAVINQALLQTVHVCGYVQGG